MRVAWQATALSPHVSLPTVAGKPAAYTKLIWSNLRGFTTKPGETSGIGNHD